MSIFTRYRSFSSDIYVLQLRFIINRVLGTKWRKFHRDAFERWKKKKRERKNFHGEDWINIVIVYYTNTRGKLHTGKWCRVKEAGNRLTPEDTRITPMYAWSFEGGSKKFGGSLFESCLQTNPENTTTCCSTLWLLPAQRTFAFLPTALPYLLHPLSPHLSPFLCCPPPSANSMESDLN